MNEPEMDQWATHLPTLVAAVAATKGPILECGVGIWSTPILHAMCAPSKRPLLSVESKTEWLNRFISFRSDYHSVYQIADWNNELQLTTATVFDVAFVDHGYAPRGPVVAALRDRAKIVIMHDSECGYCGYTEPLKAFDWVWTHTFSPAWTTIAGMGERPAWIEQALSPGVAGVPKPYR